MLVRRKALPVGMSAMEDFPPADITPLDLWALDLWSQYEFVAVNNNRIHLSDGGNDYIYEVEAVWSQGRSFYAFRIDSVRE